MAETEGKLLTCDVADQRMRRELDGGIQRSMF